jgi:hypothetical protein
VTRAISAAIRLHTLFAAPSCLNGYEMNGSNVEDTRQQLERGLSDPDGFFAGRGLTLTCHTADGVWWAALAESAPRYGRGPSELEAKRSAVRRWIVEEEGPDLRRQPGDPLP